MTGTGRPTPPSKLAIGIYWECRLIPGTDYMPVIDAGELECFACGRMDTETAHWHGATGPLERCHVIPFSLGGSNDVSNYVMLCKRCHLEAPDVDDPKFMWLWIVTHERNGGIAGSLANMARTAETMQAMGIDIERFCTEWRAATDDERRAAASAIPASWHFDNDGRLSHGTRAALASKFLERPAVRAEPACEPDERAIVSRALDMADKELATGGYSYPGGQEDYDRRKAKLLQRRDLAEQAKAA